MAIDALLKRIGNARTDARLVVVRVGAVEARSVHLEPRRDSRADSRSAARCRRGGWENGRIRKEQPNSPAVFQHSG